MPLRVILIGFGNVGRALATVLARRRSRFPGLARLGERVVAVTTRSRGSLVNPEGVDLSQALTELEQGGCFSPHNPEISHLNSHQAARSLDYDVLVELSPLDVEQRGEPAISHLRTALQRGRHVVTANKGPVAFAYRELSSLARGSGCALLFEATVMDGAPLFNMARSSLEGCRILGFQGILNSTTNFVLSRMETGESLESAVRLAQDRGFAEADPRLDLEGWDGAAKISVLVNALMGREITPLEVERQSLLEVDPRRVREAMKHGKRLKYLCRAQLEGDQVRAGVRLEEIDAGHPFAMVSGAGSMLSIRTDLMTPIFVAQEDPTTADTAYGVLADLLAIRRGSWER